MNDLKQMILEKAKSEGISKAMGYYSIFVSASPKRKYQANLYNTVKGRVSIYNQDYNSQLVKWKKNKLFPFFLNLGFTKDQLNEAWKNSVFKK